MPCWSVWLSMEKLLLLEEEELPLRPLPPPPPELPPPPPPPPLNVPVPPLIWARAEPARSRAAVTQPTPVNILTVVRTVHLAGSHSVPNGYYATPPDGR